MRKYHSLGWALTLTAFLCGCASDGDGPEVEEISGSARLTFPIHMPTPGEEGFFCYGFDASAFAGRHVRGFHWEPPQDAGIQLHHGLLYGVLGPYPDGPTPCDATPDASVALHAYTPGGESYELPAGVGLELPPDTLRFAIQVHVLRTVKGPPATVRVDIDLYDDPPEHLATRFGANAPVPTIEPHETVSSTSLCRVEEPMHVIGVWPHMHKIGSEFFGQLIRTQGERETIIHLDPWNWDGQKTHPISFEFLPGDEIETTCVWENPNPTPVKLGPLTTDEMCQQVFVAWPVEAARCTEHY